MYFLELDKKFKDTTRFIERIEENNKIYEKQNKKMEELAMTKKPVFNQREIVKMHGLMELEKLNNLEKYDKYFKMMNVNEFHLFILSNITNEEEEKFWKESLLLWQNMFPNDVAVSTQILIKKLAELIKLPNQTETNARDVLEFIFDPENNKETEFSQFCAFLAMFDQVQQQFVR